MSSVRKDTANFLANLIKTGGWVLQIHHQMIRGALERRLYEVQSEAAVDEEESN